MVVDEHTGLKRYPVPLEPVRRLHWEDPAADHLMTHEVCGYADSAFLIEVWGAWGSYTCENTPFSLSILGHTKENVKIEYTIKKHRITCEGVWHIDVLYAIMARRPKCSLQLGSLAN